MTEKTNNNSTPTTDAAPAPAVPYTGPETSQQRMIKYGANVVLASVLVIALAVIVVWLGEKYDIRKDATGDDSYSLKPQTVSIIKELQQPVKLVSLYPRLKQDPKDKNAQQDYYQPIVDILDEYRRNSKNIEVEAIDPVAEPVKIDQWLGEVTRKYGGNVSAYRDLLKAFPETLKKIQNLAKAERERINKLPEDILQRFSEADEQQAFALIGAVNTVRQFPAVLAAIDEGIQEELKQKLPNYKREVEGLETSLGQFSRSADAVHKRMEELSKNEKAPKEAKDYAAGSLANFTEIKKLCDDVLAKIKGLGELKVNEVYQRFATPEGEQPAPAIAVMGANDIKLIDVADLWKSGESTGLGTGTQDGPPKLRFTGEQRVTAAILSLTRPEKQLVVIVRGGGEPKTGGMMGGGPYSDVAERLRAYNFEVKEKDITGQFAQMAMSRGMPMGDEASDEELKKAIWVVVSEPMSHPQFGPIPGGNPELGNRLKVHLDEGGSALCLIGLQGGDLSEALKEWGVQAKPNMIAVHDPIRTDASPGEDFVEYARRQPPIFVVNDYGGPHPVTDTIQSLDGAIVPLLPVIKTGAEGATVTPLLPIPTGIPAWGESDTSFLFNRRGEAPTFDPKSEDMAPPLFAGAAVEKKDKGRVVVIGSADFINNGMLAIPDPKLSKNNIQVVRFPGNAELFMNSIFWLAKQEKMIALSPAAMETARIQPIGSGMLAFWRIGVLLIGLPALALVGGLMVYRARTNEG